MHAPTQMTSYRVDGFPPLLHGDPFFVTGCPLATGSGARVACISVHWLNPSTKLLINGRPALISSSIPICQGPAGAMPGIITAVQSLHFEPDELTIINN